MLIYKIFVTKIFVNIWRKNLEYSNIFVRQNFNIRIRIFNIRRKIFEYPNIFEYSLIPGVGEGVGGVGVGKCVSKENPKSDLGLDLSKLKVAQVHE